MLGELYCEEFSHQRALAAAQPKESEANGEALAGVSVAPFWPAALTLSPRPGAMATRRERSKA